MATNDVSLSVVNLAPAQQVIQQVSSADSSGTAATQPQIQLPQSSSSPSSGGSAGAQQNSAQVQQQIENALKNTGVKAEIEDEEGMGMIVRLVDANSGQLFMQLPPQAVLDLVAQVTSQIDLEMSRESAAPSYTGNNIDQVA